MNFQRQLPPPNLVSDMLLHAESQVYPKYILEYLKNRKRRRWMKEYYYWKYINSRFLWCTGEEKKGAQAIGVMASDESHDFQISGPKNLQADWNDSHYRISAVACLVQGVYVLEGDRCGQSRNLAPHWCESFGFQYPTEILVDEEDQSIFGAIYELKPQVCLPKKNLLTQTTQVSHRYDSAPKYVVSFRGTVLKPQTQYKDIKVDARISLGTLHNSSRFKQAMEAVENKVRSVGAAKFWLAGHSQGAAIAMLVGKEMAKKECFIETYLFNPPNIPGPLEWLKNPKLKRLTHLTSNIIKVGVAFALQGHHLMPQDDQYVKLSSWTPFLFVNPADHICSKYIADFEFNNMMKEFGLGNLERFAMLNPIKTLCLGALGKDSKPFHVIPSAYLNINSSPPRGLKQDHGIQQWWSPDFECQSILYMCGSETTNGRIQRGQPFR